MNSEIKVAFPSEKLSIKGCIQQPTPQYENEVIVGLWIFYNFSEALQQQVTMRLHRACKYSINMIRNVYSVVQFCAWHRNPNPCNPPQHKSLEHTEQIFPPPKNHLQTHGHLPSEQ